MEAPGGMEIEGSATIGSLVVLWGGQQQREGWSKEEH